MRIKSILVSLALLLLASMAFGDSVTIDLANSVDDTEARRRSDEIGQGANFYTGTATQFGHIKVGGFNYDSWNYTRFALNIPRASKITAANLSFKSFNTRTQTFNTTIYGLLDDSKWRGSDGFHTDNYADAPALNAINHMSTSVAWNNVAGWTADNWHDSPDISALLQDMIHEMGGTNEYNPLDSEDKYVGLKIDEGDGIWVSTASDWRVRAPYSYDGSPANAAELDVTYDPWAEIKTGNGMKYDSDCDCYRYFDY